jgi:hypothetical protein
MDEGLEHAQDGAGPERQPHLVRNGDLVEKGHAPSAAILAVSRPALRRRDDG